MREKANWGVAVCFTFLVGCLCSHELAETAGLLAYSFGVEEVDRHIMVFKKVW